MGQKDKIEEPVDSDGSKISDFLESSRHVTTLTKIGDQVSLVRRLSKFGDLIMSTVSKSISETIGYRIARVCLAHHYRASKFMSDAGLYLGQEMVLQHLWQEDNLTQSELADRIGVQIQTIHKMIRRMEKAGLVTKLADEHDGRVSRIHLTPKGHGLQTVVEDAWNQLEQQTLADFSVEERYILRRLLLKLEQNLDKSE